MVLHLHLIVEYRLSPLAIISRIVHWPYQQAKTVEDLYFYYFKKKITWNFVQKFVLNISIKVSRGNQTDPAHSYSPYVNLSIHPYTLPSTHLSMTNKWLKIFGGETTSEEMILGAKLQTTRVWCSKREGWLLRRTNWGETSWGQKSCYRQNDHFDMTDNTSNGRFFTVDTIQ